MSVMDIQEVLEFLPHRYPFLLIDKVIAIEPKQSLIAIKNVTMNEPFFNGHFPGNPIMPGVLILEALAQACCVLANKSTQLEISDKKYLYLFAGIDNARFKRVVVPGDQLRLEVKFQKFKQNIWKFGGTAMVDGEIVCVADMISAGREINRD